MSVMLCQHENCGQPAQPCYLPGSPTERPDTYLCAEHAPAQGHCQGCGDFWGGIESFEFWHPGWCDNCWAEFEEEEDDDYDDYEPEPFWETA